MPAPWESWNQKKCYQMIDRWLSWSGTALNIINKMFDFGTIKYELEFFWQKSQ